MDSAVHGTLLVADVAGFGDLRRNNQHQLAVRAGLYSVLTEAFARAGIPWPDCHNEDRGDGILVIAPATVPKAPFVTKLPQHLLTLLREHNATHPAEEHIRLRVSLHAGELHRDDHGVTGRSVNHAFRLVEAPTFKEAATGALLAVITSSWFYEEVVWHTDVTGYRQIPVDIKETSGTAWICLSDSDDRRELGTSPALRQLPTNVRQFVGRDEELGLLTELLDSSDTVIITAIDGSAGIGKTALALHWAHQVKDRFPDGQLYVNLRGFDQREPMDAGQALHDFLQSFGVASKSIPTDLDAKAGLYRSLLSDRRLLIVLDNARSAEHVRPLLPATSTCVTLITSRNRLDSLAVREGVHRISLDVLSRQDALALLAERVPGRQLESGAEGELVELCARLPLALSVAAARAAEQPTLSLSGLVREIRTERNRLDVLDLGEVDLSVRAVFSWSYNVLSAQAKRLFRLLGVHAGPDIDLHACHALLDRPARTWVRELTRAHLLTEYVPGRYRFHDLMRAYATELAEQDEERTSALERTLDYYLETALLADRVLQPYRDGVLRTTRPNARFTTYAEAVAWFSVEDRVLLEAVRLAADNGFVEHTWLLAWACTTYLRRNARFDDRISIQRTALEATRESADRTGHLTILYYLASAVSRVGRTDEASELLREAYTIARSLPDRAAEIAVHLAWAMVHEQHQHYPDALAHTEAALNLARQDALPMRVGDALSTMGRLLSKVGRYTEALPCCESALATYRMTGHREGQADSLVSIGVTKQHLGQYEDAIAHLEQALDLDRQLGDLYWEAVDLMHIGEVYLDSGDPVQAREVFAEAQGILEAIHHPEAEVLRIRLSTMDTHAE